MKFKTSEKINQFLRWESEAAGGDLWANQEIHVVAADHESEKNASPTIRRKGSWPGEGKYFGCGDWRRQYNNTTGIRKRK